MSSRTRFFILGWVVIIFSMIIWGPLQGPLVLVGFVLKAGATVIDWAAESFSRTIVVLVVLWSLLCR